MPLGRPGQGDYGAGRYLSTSYGTAYGYGGSKEAAVVRAVIDPKAKIADANELTARHWALVQKGKADPKEDLGTFARRMGYDVIHVPHQGYYNVVNPNVMIVQKTAPEHPFKAALRKLKKEQS